MAADRYVVLGLAAPRAEWFRNLAQWANAASIPVELVKCVSAEELRARLASGRPHSAVVVDGTLPALDRDLIEAARRNRCSVLVVDHGRGTDWTTLGATAVLSATFGRQELIDALRKAPRIGRADAVPTSLDVQPAPTWRGTLAMVCGPGGTGTSTVATALAQALGKDVRNGGMVALADLARHAEQALLHDAGDVVPGVQELVEAYRHGRPVVEDVRALTFAVPGRGYHLLLGLRRPSAWSTIRPRAFEVALAGLTGAFRIVVCDTDSDLEGEGEGGSMDVEERNVMARTTAAAADVVFTVGASGVKGVHSLVRVIGELVAFGVDPHRIVPVVNRVPRGHRPRMELTSALHALLPAADELQPIVFLSERRVDDAIRDGAPMPAAIGDPLRHAFEAAVASNGRDRRPDDERPPAVLQAVVPGTLGFAGDDDAGDAGDVDDTRAAG